MPRQALHAKSLGFQHPTTGEQVYFESELPEDFRTVLAKWDGLCRCGACGRIKIEIEMFLPTTLKEVRDAAGINST